MIKAVSTCLRGYFTFSGRAARPEFWYFILFLFLVHILLVSLNTAIFGPQVSQFQRFNADGDFVGTGVQYTYNGGVFGNLFGLATLIPWLAVGWRRMHDINRPGYLPWLLLLAWFVVVLVFVASFIGFGEITNALSAPGRVNVPAGGFGIVLLISYFGILLLNLYWLTRPSDPNTNQYGPNPTEVTT